MITHRICSMLKHGARKTAKGFAVLLICVGALQLSGGRVIAPAQAACCERAACSCMMNIAHGVINSHTTNHFRQHRTWMVRTYFYQYILPAMMRMTEQLSAVAMLQMQIIGTFLDAKHLLETERLYQQLAAQAHKDYHPSEGLCTMGTVIRSLAASERKSEVVAAVLAQRSIKRQLLNVNLNSAEGPLSDRAGRLKQFKERYCDKNDNNKGLVSVCDAGVTAERVNKDIDYTRTIANPMTIDLNLSGSAVTPDEEDVLALSANLFAHNVFRQIPAGFLQDNNANQELYMDMRSIVAKRSVAEHSFHAITAMKAAGADSASETAKYLEAALEALGISAADAKEMLGENPSYYAQMEILTKKIFQTPDFFINLYDKPTNVARKGVALQALGMMQDRDLFKSNLRSEAMLSILLELEIVRAQEAVQNQINRLTGF